VSFYFSVNLTCKTLSNGSAAVTALTESPNTSGAKLRPPSGYTTKGVLLICARKSLRKMSLYYTLTYTEVQIKNRKKNPDSPSTLFDLFTFWFINNIITFFFYRIESVFKQPCGNSLKLFGNDRVKYDKPKRLMRFNFHSFLLLTRRCGRARWHSQKLVHFSICSWTNYFY